MGAAIVHDRESRQNQCILIYDGNCRFCVTSAESIRRLSPTSPSASVTYLPYQSIDAQRLLGSEYLPGRPEVAYLIDADGQIRKGLDAFIPLLSKAPGGRLLLALLEIPGGRIIASWLYRLVARDRYDWFGSMSTQLPK